MGRIDRHIDGRDEQAILHSLLLGYRAEMGDDVKQHFIRSGSMHILAVSGLHVGILYILPALLIRKIRGPVAVRSVAAFFLISLLWSYALLTGFSPSVVRAVTMCTVHRAAVLVGRKADIFHVLSLTAFIMVLSRPAILFESGFQLSFAAVAGIAGFQRPLAKLIHPKGWLPRRAWQLLTVSLAAQLSTLPLLLYYFHQFSTVSVPASLVVVPLATLLLYVGFAYLILSFLGLYPVSGFLEWLASILGDITCLMGRIPGAFHENITILPGQLIFLYLFLLLAGLYLHSRRIVWLQAALASIAGFLLVSGFREYRVRRHEGFYVFSIPHESAISFIRGREHILYRDGRIRGDPLQNTGPREDADPLEIPFALRNFCVHYRLSPPEDLCGLPDHVRDQDTGILGFCVGTRDVQLALVRFRERMILIIRRWPGDWQGLPEEFEPDILVLTDQVSCNPESLLNVCMPGMVIVDGSNHPGVHLVMEKVCRDCGIPFHSTEKDGYYVF
jgi:competence protein ComEC